MTALALLLALQGTPAQVPQGTPFSSPFQVVDTRRLAITPVLDGVFSPEEWDPLSTSGGVTSYFEWEPHKLHFAAEVPLGKDFVVSLDLRHNGWLIGGDNLEAVVAMGEGKPHVHIRMLDNTDPNNPTWRKMAGFEEASYVAGIANGQTYTVELTLEDPGTGLFPSSPGAMIAARCDLVTPEDAGSTAYLPRICTNLELAIERYDALPAGLRWNPDQTGRVVTPGEGTRMRMGFNGSDSLGLKQIELRSEGIARASTNLSQTLFPKFDNKGRAIVDYHTDVDPKAILGYRVLRGTLTSNDGGTAVMQESYRIAPLLDFDLVHDRNSVSDKDRTERFVVFLRSNSDHKVKGIFKIVPPAGFSVKDNDQAFGIYPSHGSIKRTFDLTMPADAHGTYPIKLQAVMGLKTLEQTAYIIVE